MSVALRIAGVAVGAAAVAGTLAACARDKNPDSFAYDLFQDHMDGSKGITDASSKSEKERYYTTETSKIRFGDFIQITTESRRETWNMDASKALNAADSNNDAQASVGELTALANKFDADGDGILNGKEQRAFKREYAPRKVDVRTEVLSTHTNMTYAPQHNHHDHYAN